MKGSSSMPKSFWRKPMQNYPDQEFKEIKERNPEQ